MSDAQHTQEKEALEDASNRLLTLDGIALGTLAYTMVGTWTTKDGDVVTGPGYTVRFVPSAQLKAWKAAYDAAQAGGGPVNPPPPDPVPKAGFTVTVNGLVATITDASVNAADEVWSFGDGIGSSNQGSAGAFQHAYTAAGTYTITQEVRYGAHDDTAMQSVTVAAPVVDPQPAFVVTADGLTVSIKDKSVLNGGSEAWDFGDGLGSQVQGDLTHTYAQAGGYTITLTITGADGRSFPVSQTVTVTAPVVDPPPPTGTAPNIGAIQPGDTWTPPDAA